MSRRASVVFFLGIALVASAAFGQTPPNITYVTLENGDIQVQFSGGSGPGGRQPAQYEVKASFSSTTDGTVRVIDRTAAVAALSSVRYRSSEIPNNAPVQITVVAVDSTGGRSPAPGYGRGRPALQTGILMKTVFAFVCLLACVAGCSKTGNTSSGSTDGKPGGNAPPNSDHKAEVSVGAEEVTL